MGLLAGQPIRDPGDCGRRTDQDTIVQAVVARSEREAAGKRWLAHCEIKTE